MAVRSPATITAATTAAAPADLPVGTAAAGTMARSVVAPAPASATTSPSAFTANNLFNDADLAQPNGNLSSSEFGKSTQLANSFYTSNSALRRISLQTSFSF